MIGAKGTYRVVIAGAAGSVGRELVEILEERGFPVGDLVLLDSEDAAGERIDFCGSAKTVGLLDAGSFKGADIVFITPESGNGRGIAAAAAASGAVVIDGSRHSRRDKNIPLVIPEVNSHVLQNRTGVVANPTPITIGLVMALKPIHDRVRIKRIVVTVFLSVSENGKAAVDELAGQTVALLNFRDVEKKVYPHQIAFNCVPQAGTFQDDGSSDDEVQIAYETIRILEDEKISISATMVIVPVFRCHAVSINIETEKFISPNETRAVLAEWPGIIVYDEPKKGLYPLPIDVSGKDEIYVGRIREDNSVRNGISLWTVFDNIRKGAALNAVQIAELLIKPAAKAL